MSKLPRATSAPEPRTPYGRYAGFAAAAVMVGFALIHLFRIDTLIPIVQVALPFADSIDAFLVAALVVVEVFAVPSLLMMRLSPFARMVSGLFVVLAPLSWLLVTIWTYGVGISVGLLGEFVDTPSNGLLIAVLGGWLAGNYAALWLLRFDDLPLPWPKRSSPRKP